MAKQSGKKKSPARKPAAKRTTKDQSNKRVLVLSLIAAATLVIVAAVIAVTVIRNRTSSGPGPITGESDVSALLQGIPEQNTALGRPDAPVTLIEYADMKCPVCQRFSTTTLPQIINDYVRPGKVRIIFQYQTFVGRQTSPGDSERAARFGLAAGEQNKLWDYSELFYHNQGQEDQTYVTDQFLTDLGNQVPGLNVQQALSQMDSPAVTQEIQEAQAAFKGTGFDGVPSFQIGKTGGTVTNIPPDTFDYGPFKTAIDKLLAQ